MPGDLSVCARHGKEKRRPGAGVTFKSDSSAMSLNDATGNVETEPGTRCFVASPGLIGFEDLLTTLK
jgi:hypothetical protein